MSEILDFPRTKDGTPDTDLLKVAGNGGKGRKSDDEYGRIRSHLTPSEVAAVIKAAGQVGRHPHRDRTLLLIAYRHGLRVSELIGLKWDQVEFKAARLHVNRIKSGTPATHPMEGDELRALRRLKREYPDSHFIFPTERGGPLCRSAVNKIIKRAGEKAKISFPITPHQLRHACGYYLANKGFPTRTIQAYLGHSNIANTQRYTALSDTAFRGLWS